MLKQERQQLILNEVSQNGSVSTNKLAQKFNVTKDTIRKDFQELAKKGLVERIHGGVSKIENEIVNFDIRVGRNQRIKRILAKEALKIIQNKSIVFLDSGTTNLELAKLLPNNYSGTIITNSPHIALEVSKDEKIKIYLIGGEVNSTSKIVSGASAIREIEAINIELCILGVSSLSVDYGITYPSFEESLLKQQLIKQSNRVISIIEKEKINTVATFYCSEISAINDMITDELDDHIINQLEDEGIHVIKVNIEE